MENLKIYRVSDKYIHYLHSKDSKVQMNKNQRRPYVGVVFSFAGHNYFAPLESPKPNHLKIKSGKHILKLDENRLGIIGFNNMIPVHKTAIIEFDIDKEPDVKYRNLLKKQASVINKKKADILNCAQWTYFSVVGGKNKFLIGISCDFQTLEKACKRYDSNYNG